MNTKLNPFDRFNSDITAQEVFNHVVLHLSTMDKPSMALLIFPDYNSLIPKDKNACAYRGAGGSCCAAGYLLTSYEYRQDMEGKTFTALSNMIPNRLRPHDRLITDLQDVHDSDFNWYNEVDMIESLETVATAYDLNDNIVREVKWDRLNP